MTETQVIPKFENLEEYLRIAVIEQGVCYDGYPKPSRAIRFDYATYYGMSYLTAQVEWPSSDSSCKSSQLCPANETAREKDCFACSRKIDKGIGILSWIQILVCDPDISV